MAYYPDLSPEKRPIGKNGLFYEYVQVGWLNIENPYSHGKVSEEFLLSLWDYCRHPVKRARGFHTCDLCLPTDFEGLTLVKFREQIIKLGDGISFVFTDDKNYCFPNLIFHYVTEHHYCPPQEFIEAVINSAKPNSKEYETFCEKYEMSIRSYDVIASDQDIYYKEIIERIKNL
jgi:hypothetical protein